MFYLNPIPCLILTPAYCPIAQKALFIYLLFTMQTHAQSTFTTPSYLDSAAVHNAKKALETLIRLCDNDQVSWISNQNPDVPMLPLIFATASEINDMMKTLKEQREIHEKFLQGIEEKLAFGEKAMERVAALLADADSMLPIQHLPRAPDFAFPDFPHPLPVAPPVVPTPQSPPYIVRSPSPQFIPSPPTPVNETTFALPETPSPLRAPVPPFITRPNSLPLGQPHSFSESSQSALRVQSPRPLRRKKRIVITSFTTSGSAINPPQPPRPATPQYATRSEPFPAQYHPDYDGTHDDLYDSVAEGNMTGDPVWD